MNSKGSGDNLIKTSILSGCTKQNSNQKNKPELPKGLLKKREFTVLTLFCSSNGTNCDAGAKTSVFSLLTWRLSSVKQ